MYCDDKTEEQNEGESSSSNNLDSALHELGMLSTITSTNTNNYYFHEMRRKSFGSKPNTMNYNTRKSTPINNLDNNQLKLQQYNINFFSSSPNISIRKRRKCKRIINNRMSPYLIPDRIRTRSENSDGSNIDSKQTLLDDSQDVWMENSSNYVSVLDPKIGSSLTTVISKPSLKKSRSLENIRVENIEASQPSHEMEFVSSRIQKLKVME